ncbi:zinc finger SWIM domain-containing protein 4-like isoform X2 [Clytia hemisphaerica]|uniref:zinc finger SWIM domain-containing protein 4-like isoform X2 n=1 Tax=Clytia hemisphaerica TaxID=252671 RepID=UPI0034D7AD51
MRTPTAATTHRSHNKRPRCDSDATPTSRHKRSRPDQRKSSPTLENKRQQKVASLLDISAKSVAGEYPYQEIEERLGHIPNPVQNRILYHSFPEDEASIKLYSSNRIHMTSTETNRQPFNVGLKIYDSDGVKDVIQIGFHLSGVVHEKVGICNRQKLCVYKASMTFDRNCITSTQCSCSNKNLLWCSHIVAVAIYRIRNPTKIPIKPPISDSVLELSNQQIQKLLLTLISEKQNEILPDVQRLLDQIRSPESEISRLAGFPDPTAGGCSGEERLWHMDNSYITKQVSDDLLEGTSGKNTIALLNKVREMLSVRDNNFINLLLAITDTILDISCEQPEVQTWPHVRKIYDELQALWMCIMSDHDMTMDTRQRLMKYLKKVRESPSFPRENGDDPKSGYLLEPCLNDDTQDDLWTIGAEIDCLNLRGDITTALQKAKQILKTLKQSRNSFYDWKMFNKPTEPIFVAYNMFTANGLESEAVELALIALSQSYTIPHGEYAQSRLTHRYEQLISQLESLDLSKDVLQNTLLKYTKKYYDSLLQKAEENESMDILPNHCFVRFLFQKVVPLNKQLACDIALHLLPLNLNKNNDVITDDVIEDELMEFEVYNDVISYVKTHLEYQQSELAACLLKECHSGTENLKLTLTAILENVNQPEQLLRLAKLCQSMVTRDQKSIINQDFQSAAFELGVRSVRLITDVLERKSCIRWLVSCAVDTGRAAVEFLLRNWTDLFSAKEIAADVAPLMTSQPVCFQLKMTSSYTKEELITSVSNMVIEACIKDPIPCVLFALTLCEENLENFELVCQIINESSDRFNAAQLFSVARYLESKKHPDRAFKVGLRALKKLDIGALDCQHPAVCDIFWISTLACSLGIDEMTQIVPVIENCIHNPLILTDIAQRCSSGTYRRGGQAFSCSKEPLNRLVASAQKLFIQDVELKLRNITRKNYVDFTDYLIKIKRAFSLADDGMEQFNWLIDFIVTSQKGKKKLHQLVTSTFLKDQNPLQRTNVTCVNAME